jgi:hypothetical protein
VDSFALRVRVGERPPVGFEVLPDGLRSLLAWLGDLLMRLDRIPWTTPGPVTDHPFVLLLDEVDVHLHPTWQARVLPMLERLFPAAQIFATTHSPFVIGSAKDASIHVFSVDEHGCATVAPPSPSALGHSVDAILRGLMGVSASFDPESEKMYADFRALWTARLTGDTSVDAELDAAHRALRDRSEELAALVDRDRRELEWRLRR